MDTTLMSEYVELHKKIIEKLYRYVEYHYLMQMMHLNYSQKMTLLLQGILPD